MKHLLTLLICLLSFTVFSQKIKFKKNVVKIDDKEMYKMVKIKDKALIRPTIQMQDMSGNTLIEIKDAMTWYEKLYYETEPRDFEYMNLIVFNTLGEEYQVPYLNRMKVGKALHKIIETTDFYKDGEIDEGFVKKVLSELSYASAEQILKNLKDQNETRIENAKLSQEKFGDAKERKPGRKIDVTNGKVSDGITVGTISLKKKGKIMNTFEIKNLNDELIATLWLDNQPGLGGSIRTVVDDKLEKFKFEKSMSDKSFDPTEKRQAEMVKYLIDMGYL